MSDAPTRRPPAYPSDRYCPKYPHECGKCRLRSWCVVVRRKRSQR